MSYSDATEVFGDLMARLKYDLVAAESELEQKEVNHRRHLNQCRNRYTMEDDVRASIAFMHVDLAQQKVRKLREYIRQLEKEKEK